MTTTRILLSLALAVGLCACGGGSSSSGDDTTAGAGSSTSGGEESPPHPIRTTTPIPVPSPPIEREALSAELQRVWDLVEAAIAIRPPEPPTEASHEAVQAWAEGPFAEWITRRVEATSTAEEALLPLEGAPPYERGVAGGLIGYLHEDTAADVRGAPIEQGIADDPELLQAYSDAMTAALHPFAERSVQAYRFCSAAFDEVGDSSWEEWASYCDDRAQEVIEVFRVESGESAAPAPAPSETQPATTEASGG